jgi:hypothetical protein
MMHTTTPSSNFSSAAYNPLSTTLVATHYQLMLTTLKHRDMREQMWWSKRWSDTLGM